MKELKGRTKRRGFTLVELLIVISSSSAFLPEP